MFPVQIFVATRDGQSNRIAERLHRGLNRCAVDAEVHLLPSPSSLVSRAFANAPLIVLVAAVRYGRHLQEASVFLSGYKTTASPPPLALASVNLTARKPNRQSVSNNAYLRKLIARFALAPAIACAVAGRLDYPRYGWLDRQVIRFIMAITGGPTDGVSCVEYTNWDQVDEFAGQIVGYLRKAL